MKVREPVGSPEFSLRVFVDGDFVEWAAKNPARRKAAQERERAQGVTSSVSTLIKKNISSTNMMPNNHRSAPSGIQV